MSLFVRYQPIALGGGGGGGSSGIASINSDTTSAQTLIVGSTGTDFAIVDGGAGVHTFNIPSASATARGLVTTGAQTLAGNKTFSNNVSAANFFLAPSGSLDTSSAGTMAIGTANASVINIGNSGTTINLQGTTFYQNVTNLNVANKLINLNTNGSAGSASNVGIDVQENSVVTGYINTSGDRNSWQFVAPNTLGIVTMTPGASGFTLNQGSHNPVTIGTANGLSLSTQALSLAAASTSTTGALTSTDWNTFNNKQSTITTGNLTESGSANLTVTGGTGAVIGSGVLLTLTGATMLESGSSVLTITGGTNAVLGTGVSIQVKQAATAQSGYLSSADWNTFNGKQAAGSYITALTGDIAASGPGSAATTLATVNSNVGTFTNATITVNAKGLITAASSTGISARYHGCTTTVGTSATTITFTTKDYDTNNAYSSGTYTIPVAGKYLFTAKLNSPSQLATTIQVANLLTINKNGTIMDLTYVAGSGAVSNYDNQITSQLDCAQGDTITVQATFNVAGVPAASDPQNVFTVAYLGK